jgi:hypothetical protein
MQIQQQNEERFTYEDYLAKFNREREVQEVLPDESAEFAEELARETVEIFEKALRT